MIIRNAYAFDFGGGEIFPVNLAEQLSQHGYEPLIISRSDKLLDYARQKNVQSKKGWWWSRQGWGGYVSFLLPIYFLWQIALTFYYISQIVTFRPDVIHPQSRDDFIAASIAGRLFGKTVVWTDHADLKYIFANHKVWYKNPIGKLVYYLSKKVDAVTLVSQSEMSLISEALGQQPPANYQVIHNGITSQPIKPAVRPSKYKAGEVLFAATSRLVTAKGIGELIEAFKELRKTHKSGRLLLFGEGPELKKFKALADSEPNIEFCGWPANSLEQVAYCDVFVHPSYHEGFSLSLIEAAKLGLPIIACNEGGNPEIIQNNQNGLLIPAKDISALYKAMAKLADDKALRQKFGQSAKKTYQANFVLENIVLKKFIPIYEATK